jgi:hypothetical protein
MRASEIRALFSYWKARSDRGLEAFRFSAYWSAAEKDYVSAEYDIGMHDFDDTDHSRDASPHDVDDANHNQDASPHNIDDTNHDADLVDESQHETSGEVGSAGMGDPHDLNSNGVHDTDIQLIDTVVNSHSYNHTARTVFVTTPPQIPPSELHSPSISQHGKLSIPVAHNMTSMLQESFLQTLSQDSKYRQLVSTYYRYLVCYYPYGALTFANNHIVIYP